VIEVILLDMDDVMADFVPSAARLFGKDPEEVMARWRPGHYDIEEALGITTENLWGAIDSAGEEYWATMPETPWARRLYAELQGRAPVVFLSSPSRHPSSLSGKIRWLQAFTGNPQFREFLLGPRKDLCANPRALLIDDDERNIKAFWEKGGNAILFPRKWNSEYEIIDPCDFTLNALRPLFKAL